MGKAGRTLKGQEFRHVCTLSSKDLLREADVLAFRSGETYLRERESCDGQNFAERHGGGLVGPFVSPEVAERFIIATAWFNGEGEE